jgi:hypothetical protein
MLSLSKHEIDLGNSLLKYRFCPSQIQPSGKSAKLKSMREMREKLLVDLVHLASGKCMKGAKTEK